MLLQEQYQAEKNMSNLCSAKATYFFNKKIIIISSISNQDVLVRATGFSFLCTLNPAHAGHRRLVTDIIKLTMERYVELSKNQSLTFVNSLVHRQRHRLVQLLLLTESFIEDVSRIHCI